MSSKRLLLAFYIVFLLKSCICAEKEEEEDMIDLDDENRPKPDDKKYFYVPVFLTNDIHGNYYWTDAESSDGTEYKSGGLDYLASYLTILRKEFGEDRVLYFDSGDEFTPFMGKAKNPDIFAKLVMEFFNTMKLDAATLGNHDYDFDREELDALLDTADFPYLMGNIYDEENETDQVFHNQKPYQIYKIPTGSDTKKNLKIGVIGLTNVLNKIPSGLGDVSFDDYAEKTVEYAKVLRNEGCDSIILLAHCGLQCKDQQMSYGVYSKEDSSDSNGCSREMMDAMEKIPKGTIDAVLTGHSHMENHIWIKGTPILSGTNMAAYSNVLYLAFDKKTFEFVADEVKMEGPLPTCEKIFTKSKDCKTSRGGNTSNNGQLVEYSYHGVKIEKEPLLEKLSKKYIEYKQ